MKYIISFALLLFLLHNYTFAQSSLHLFGRPKVTTPSLNFFKNTVTPTPPQPAIDKFEKNGYNPRNNTVWRENQPNDGQVWWIDEELGVYWRYLREDENPETLQVSQNRVSDFCRT